MNLKSQIMAAIEQGLTNQEIHELTVTTPSYIAEVRYQYNLVATKSIKSGRPRRKKAPRAGSKSRAVYDLIFDNPRIESGEIVAKTGVNYGAIHWVRVNYFGHKVRANPWIPHANALHTVELSELKL